MPGRVLYERGAPGRPSLVALALLCRHMAEVGRRTIEDCDESRPDEWGIPAAVLRPLQDLRTLGCRLMDERGQADAVFSCCADEPELESPVAETQWLPLVLTVNSRIIEFIRELAVWMD